MAKTKISEFSSTPGNNTDIDSINIAEGCAPSGINDAIRELMAQLKDFQQGTAGDSFNGPVGTTTAAAGAFTTLAASGAVTLSGGTANGVPYLNGSKVLTTGSALTFDGTNLGINNTAPASKLDVIGSGAFRVDGSGSTTPLVLRNNNTASTQLVKLGFDSNGLIKASINAAVYGNDYMTFNVGSDAEQMRLTSTGLGIGTSSPGSILDIVGSGNPTLTLRGSAGAYTSVLKLQAAGGGSSVINATGASSDNLQLQITGVTKATLDSSGNLGLGVTPSASQIPQLQISRGAFTGDINSSYVSNNWYYNGGDKYIGTNYALQYKQAAINGQHQWYTAPSGTAGNAISFTQAMTLDASGNLIVGDTSQVGSSKISMTVNPSLANVLAAKTSTNGDIAVFRILSSDGNEQGAVNVNTSGQNMTFRVANTERARIDSSGNLLVGTTSSDPISAQVNGLSIRGAVGDILASAGNTPALQLARRGSDGGVIQFYKNTTAVGSVSTTSVLTTYNTTSDYRLKTVIGAVSGAGQRIDALEPVEYEWKSEGSRTRGFLAHKFQEVYPQSVSGEKDAVDADGKPVYQNMQAGTSEVIADLVAEIQSLRKRLAAAGI